MEEVKDNPDVLKSLTKVDKLVAVGICRQADRLFSACAHLAQMYILDPDSVSTDETMKLKQALEKTDQLLDVDEVTDEITPAVKGALSMLNRVNASHVSLVDAYVTSIGDLNALWRNDKVLPSQLPDKEKGERFGGFIVASLIKPKGRKEFLHFLESIQPPN